MAARRLSWRPIAAVALALPVLWFASPGWHPNELRLFLVPLVAALVLGLGRPFVRDQKRVLPVAALLEGEDGIDGIFMGVPCKLGAEGLEQIIEVELTDSEKAELGTSADAVRELVGVLGYS